MNGTRRIVWMALLGVTMAFAGGQTESCPTGAADTKAGYNDGCRSGQGHYTRSSWKYTHSSRYRAAWLRGKKACTRTQAPVRPAARTPRSAPAHSSCTNEVSWEAFRRGWKDGYASANGHFYVDRRGCAAYRHGWVSGYRDCHCPETQRPDSYDRGYYHGCHSVYNFKIRDDKQYRHAEAYRVGWDQGYRDCQGRYR